MTSVTNVGRFLMAIMILAILLPAYSREERESCISRAPSPSGDGPGYELLNLVDGEVWGTRNWTPEAYAAFSLPVSWPQWQKNDPRIVLADQSQFLQSPGCEPGQYSYMRAFDREFVQVVQLIDIPPALDPQGLIRAVELEKHHVLHYSTGRSVSLLQNPAGQQFIGVSRSLESSAELPTLPEGWTLTNRLLTEDLQVDLVGRVSVLRLDNEDSYQGPLPEETWE